MEIDARGSEKSLSFCYLKIDNIFCVSRLTREGSGTTGHAVMQLNKEDSGNRQSLDTRGVGRTISFSDERDAQ